MRGLSAVPHAVAAAVFALGLLLPASGAENNPTLREYVDARFEAQEKAVEAALAAVKEQGASAQAAADRAVLKAETATEKRFEGVNEFRQALADNTRTLMPRAEAEQQLGAITKKVEDLTKRMDARDEQSRGLSQGWTMLVALVLVIATVIGAVVAVRKRNP